MGVFSGGGILPTQDRADSAWNRLALSTPQPDPFCATTHWQLAFREAFDPDRPFIVRYDSDGLVQFALHSLYGGRPALGPIERTWLFGCNVIGNSAPNLLEELLFELREDEETRTWPVGVSGLDPKGALAASLRSRFDQRYSFNVSKAGVQCAASLEGGLEGFLSRRSGNLRRNLRRYSTRASEMGVLFERHVPTTVEDAAVLFERLIAVEQASWKGIGRCGMDQPRTRRFYWAMLSRLARSGDARVMVSTHEGRDIGYIFGGVAAGIYRGQQFSFDDRYAALSLGNLMQFEQISWLCEEGAQRYDLGPLLGLSMAYKHHWTELKFPIEAWSIQAR
jgi:hypothetical protein